MISRQSIDIEDAARRVLAAIDEDAVVDLAVRLGSIDSAAGAEREAGDFVYDWMDREGFAPRRVGLLVDRFNVVGRLPAAGAGRSLAFNSHLDTSVAVGEVWSTVHADDPIYHTAWREGPMCYGNGLCNDKGQMACWLIACKAVKDTLGELPGELVLTAACGEIELEPIDEFQGPEFASRELGTRYAINHGAVADMAVVAEATDFHLGWVEAGNMFFKITVFGAEPPIYNPFVDRSAWERSPNAIVLAAEIIRRLEEWALEYEPRHRYQGPGGTVTPRVNIGAVRGGLPYKISKTAQAAAIYLDVRITPEQYPTDVQAELRDVLRRTGIPYELELYTFRPGREARGVEPLVHAIGAAHRSEFGGEVEMAGPVITSMWRDINSYAEAGIPCVMYGPGPTTGAGNFAMKVEDLVHAARLYARIALGVTAQPRQETA
jgi:acetylornithine deacetylase/succinyl-diaminopimelate desuccinylase-like protein